MTTHMLVTAGADIAYDSPPEADDRGMEFAGRVADVGTAVTEVSVGDEVFGIEGGANAEYVAARESGVIAPKPTALTSEEAAAAATARCSR